MFRSVLGPARTLALAAICVFALSFASPRASAQGTQGTLPDPISTNELSEYATRLKLSDQQRAAAQDQHDQYKSEFRELRDGEIASFMKEMRELNEGMGRMPPRERVESFVKQMTSLQGKIATLDSRFFDNLQNILTPDQQAMLPRVRQARQRARYSSNNMMMMSGSPTVDISEIVLAMDLPADQFLIADPILSSYESKLTSSFGKLYEASTNMILSMFEAFEAQGINEDTDFQDPEVAKKLQEAMMAMWKTITAKSTAISNDILELNRRTSKNLIASLAPDQARILRNAYLQQAYPEVGYLAGNDDATAHAIRNSQAIPADQRDAVIASADEFLAKIDQIVDQAIHAHDEWRKEFSPFDLDAEKMQEHQKNTNELATKANELRLAFHASLATTLGQQAFNDIQVAANLEATRLQTKFARTRFGMGQTFTAPEPEDADADELAPELADSDSADSEAVTSSHGWTGDWFAPPAIGKLDLNSIARRLNLNPDQRAVLNQVHRDYKEKFEEVRKNQIDALVKSQQSMWSYDEATQKFSSPDISVVDDNYKLRLAVMDAVRKADESFFDDVDLVLTNTTNKPQLKRARMARERACYNRQTNVFWSAQNSNESSLDLSTLVDRMRLDEALSKKTDAILIEYENKLTPAFRAKYEAALNLQRAQDRWQIELRKAQDSEGGGGSIAVAMQFQELLKEPSDRVAKTSGEVADLNRSTIESLIALLPTDLGYQLRTQYNRKAFPNVYSDPASIDKQLNEAVKLSDLGDPQRQKLEELVAEYRPAYATLSEHMVVASTGSESTNIFGSDTKAIQEYQKREEALAKLRFDRDELNARSAEKLKTILSPEQLQNIGGLPNAKP